MSFLKLAAFKVSVPKPKRKKINDGITRTSNKIVKGRVFKDEEGIYKFSISMENNPLYPDLRVFDFTERSYDLTGKTNVFSRNPNKKGKYTRYIRNEANAKYMPGLPEQYVPFAPNWIVRGYIVRDQGINKFDFKSLVGIDGYKMEVLHPEDD